MRPRDLAELVLLAAIWGASFLFMRLAVPAFGPLPLAWTRVAGASLLLLPLLLLAPQGRAQARAGLAHWRPLLLVAFFNSVVPFTLFAYATASVEAGVAAILNAATPLFSAALARLWLGERLSRMRMAGLAIGFAGVFAVVVARTGVRGGGAVLPVLACVGAAFSYAITPSLTRRHLAGVAPLAVAGLNQLAATAMLALPAALAWPAGPLATTPVLAAAGLSFLCTGFALLLFFRLIAHAGAQNAISVTYLIPVFAVAWGSLFLGERLTAALLAASAVVLAGTALATGLWPRRRAPAGAAGLPGS